MPDSQSQLLIAWMQYGLNVIFYAGILWFAWKGIRRQPKRGWGFLGAFAILKLLRHIPSFRIMPAIGIPAIGMPRWVILAKRVAILDMLINPVAIALLLIGLGMLIYRSPASPGGR